MDNFVEKFNLALKRLWNGEASRHQWCLMWICYIFGYLVNLLSNPVLAVVLMLPLGAFIEMVHCYCPYKTYFIWKYEIRVPQFWKLFSPISHDMEYNEVDTDNFYYVLVSVMLLFITNILVSFMRVC